MADQSLMFYQESPDFKRNRELALALREQAAAQPVTSTLGGLAKMGSMWASGWMEGEAKRKEEARKDEYNKTLARALQAAKLRTNPDTGLPDPNTGGMEGALSVLGQNDATAPLAAQWQIGRLLDQQDMADKLALAQAEAGLKKPSSVQEYEYAKKNGYAGSYQDFITSTARSELPSNVREWQFFKKLVPSEREQYLAMKRANRPVDIGGSVVVPSQIDPGAIVGEIPKTVPPEQSPEVKGEQAAAAAEGVFEGERPERFASSSNAMRELEIQRAVVVQDIDRAIDMTGLMTTGIIGSLSGAIPGTPAHDLAKVLDGIKANIGFDKLQAMRDASPTGGALGQVTERENTLLQSVLGSLEQSQTEGQFVTNLRRLKKALHERQKARDAAFAHDFGKDALNALRAERNASGSQKEAVPTGGKVLVYDPETDSIREKVEE
jgi:hypothetical protein